MSARDSTLQLTGEGALIERIRSWLGPACPPSPQGIGDDCAVLPARNADSLITVDPVVQDVHFEKETSPAAVARKVLRRNLSDIAAMGGVPRHAVVALVAPPDTRVDWLRKFFVALGRDARRYGVTIVGGDCTATTGALAIVVTLSGSAPDRPLTRTGANRGDRIYVTGTLGGSLLGRHLRFEPRLAEGAWLARQRGVRAAIDLSDGLGRDLFRIVPQRLSAVLDHQSIPISAAARKRSKQTGRPALFHALNDGEDYELLFVVEEAAARRIESAWRRKFRTPLCAIGRFESRSPGSTPVRFAGSLRDGIELLGHEHFR